MLPVLLIARLAVLADPALPDDSGDALELPAPRTEADDDPVTQHEHRRKSAAITALAGAAITAGFAVLVPVLVLLMVVPGVLTLLAGLGAAGILWAFAAKLRHPFPLRWPVLAVVLANAVLGAALGALVASVLGVLLGGTAYYATYAASAGAGANPLAYSLGEVALEVLIIGAIYSPVWGPIALLGYAALGGAVNGLVLGAVMAVTGRELPENAAPLGWFDGGF